MKNLFWTLFILISGILVCSVLLEVITIGQSDLSVRVYMSLSSKSTFFWNESIDFVLNHNWGFGYFFLQKVFIHLSELFSDNYDVILKCIICLGIFFYCFTAFLSTKFTNNKDLNFLFGFLVLCYPTLLAMSASTFSELYTLPFVALVMFFFIKSNMELKLLLVSALFLLFTTTIRTEVISVAFGLSAYLIYKRKYFKALVFGLISCSYFILRFLYSILFVSKSESFFNHNTFVYDTNGLFQVWIMLSDYIMPSGLLLIIILIILRLNRDKLKLTKNSEIFLFALAGHVLLIYAVASGRSIGSERFFMIPGNLIIGTIVFSIQSINPKSLKAITISTVSVAILVITQYLFYPIPSIALSYKPRPKEINEALEWLKINDQNENIYIDFLSGWDQHIQLYTSSGDKFDNYSFAHFPPIDCDERSNNTATSIAYITQYQPKWIVSSSEDYFEKLSKKHYQENYLAASFIKKYFVRGADSLEFPNHRPISLQLVFSNKMIAIYEAEY
jgi:hypothetical protein